MAQEASHHTASFCPYCPHSWLAGICSPWPGTQGASGEGASGRVPQEGSILLMGGPHEWHRGSFTKCPAFSEPVGEPHRPGPATPLVTSCGPLLREASLPLLPL